jgi:hypothetical protein
MSSRAEVLQQLRDLGVETATAEYDGYGDSGQLEDPQFGSVEVPGVLATAVQNLFYDLLEEEQPGWELNEGSCGQFRWNIQADRINLAHTTRVEEYEEHDL